jgi:hypothetical protein
MATMTPSEIVPATAGQFGKVCDNLTAALRKAGLASEPFQQVLENQGDELTAELLMVIQKRVEAVSKMIVRRVRVDRIRSSQAAIDATGRRQYVNRVAVEGMPVGEGDEVDLYIFKPDPDAYDAAGDISCDEVARQFDLRGLKPDPRATAAMNEADPSFGDETPNASQWKDAGGNYCFATFRRWRGKRSVGVRRDGGWGDFWSFSGVRK